MNKEREALVIAELRQSHAGHTDEGPSTFSDAADLLEALSGDYAKGFYDGLQESRVGAWVDDD